MKKSLLRHWVCYTNPCVSWSYKRAKWDY